VKLAPQRLHLTAAGLQGGEALTQRVGVGGFGLLAQRAELGTQRLNLLGGAGDVAQRVDLLGEAGDLAARAGVGLLEPGDEGA
jgi:hypothetical protein